MILGCLIPCDVKVLANLTCQTQAATSLVLKSSLVQWLEMQLSSIRNDERVACVKIIENILVTANHDQMEQATEGEWQAGLLRCLISLMSDAGM